MNNLSWFIYATQVTDELRDITGFTVACVGILAAIATPFCGMALAEGEMAKETAARLLKWVVLIVSIGALFLVVTPSRQTMLLIAGSEMGERAIKSEAVTGIVNPGMDLVKLWIKQETDKLTAKEAK